MQLSADTQPTDEVERSVREAFAKMMGAMHSQQGASLTIGILTDPKVKDFIDTHTQALNQAIQTAAMSQTMRSSLQDSNYVFSGIKAFHELNEAFPSLLDGDGNKKPFNTFLNDVKKIGETYNVNYLRTEYRFASASAEMAGRWESFMESGDRYDLQYRTAGDDKVREEHAKLQGITLPPSDPWWDEYFPPNGWGCRCTVVQVRKGKYPTTDRQRAYDLSEDVFAKDKKGMFRFNPGKGRTTFPDYNPYTTSDCRTCTLKTRLAAPPNELCAVCQTFIDPQWREHIAQDRKTASNEAKAYFNALFPDRRTPISIDKGERGTGTGILRLDNDGARQCLRSDKHSRTSELKWAFVIALKNADKLRYLSIKPLGEGKDLNNPKDAANVAKKALRGVVAYHYYTFDHRGKRYLLGFEEMKIGDTPTYEQPYFIVNK